MGLAAKQIREAITSFKGGENASEKPLKANAPPYFFGAGSACASAAGLITHAAQ
jgi:hypothetical protein